MIALQRSRGLGAHRLHRGLALSILAGCAATATRCAAEEMVTPLLAGVTIGAPLGMAPPAGFYVSTTALYLKGTQADGSGRRTSLSFHELEISQALLLATDIRVLGGRLSLSAIQPVKGTSAYSPTMLLQQVGAYNTILSPVNLSWDIGRGAFVSWGTTFYLPDGTYSAFGPKVANGFFTVEQNVAFAYERAGYTLSANFALDLNTINPTTDYRSGHVLGVDFAATRGFGNLSVGIGGYLVEQLSDDRLHGRVVAASTDNGRGNRWREFALGPYVGYDFGAVRLAAWYTQDIVARNTIQAGTGWLRVTLPLGDGFNRLHLSPAANPPAQDFAMRSTARP